jgi:hypothetical protein
MTKDEALDLALNALLWANIEINDWRDDAHGYTPEDQPQIMAAITAIKQARALDKKAENARELGLDYEPVQELCRTDGRCQYAIDSGAEGVGHCPPGKCCMPAPVQEPVAWIWKYANGEEEVVFVPPRHVDASHVDAPSTITPLYTTPPAAQRQWVGLTDEEMQALWDRYAHMEMMRAIEAKLKEKNT